MGGLQFGVVFLELPLRHLEGAVLWRAHPGIPGRAGAALVEPGATPGPYPQPFRQPSESFPAATPPLPSGPSIIAPAAA